MYPEKVGVRGGNRVAVASRGTVSGETEDRRALGAQAIEQVKEQHLRWVELFYTDLFGGYNHVHIPSHTLEAESFVSGVPKLDGSSVRGFREIYESDMLLVPDASTFATIPWESEHGGTARFICDIQ